MEEERFSLTRRNKSIRKVREWQNRELEITEPSPGLQEGSGGQRARPAFRGRTPSYEALRCAVTELYRIDDFDIVEVNNSSKGFFPQCFEGTSQLF